MFKFRDLKSLKFFAKFSLFEIEINNKKKINFAYF